MVPHPPSSTLFPYTTLFRSRVRNVRDADGVSRRRTRRHRRRCGGRCGFDCELVVATRQCGRPRSGLVGRVRVADGVKPPQLRHKERSVMDELLDTLAKDTAAGMSRRKAFRRFGWGLAVAAFAALGIKRAS